MSKLIELIELPPVWLIACIGAAWWLSQEAPLMQFTHPFWDFLGWALIAAGLVLAFWAMLAFRRFKTSVIPRQTPSALINEGPYRFSRNPIYLADLIILAGCVALFGGLSAALTLPLFWAAMQYRFILPEENVLNETFGDVYAAYCRSVRRWL